MLVLRSRVRKSSPLLVHCLSKYLQWLGLGQGLSQKPGTRCRSSLCMSEPYGYQDPDHLDHHRGLLGCPLAGAGITSWSQDYNPGPLRESGVIPTARSSPLLGEEFSLDCIGTYEIKLACLLVPTILYFLKQLLICLRFSFPTLKDVATL